MTTTVEAVERHLETDLVMHVALDRGILNVRQAARWLIATQGWDATEEAVVSALRRFDPDIAFNLEEALHLLPATELTAGTGFSIFTYPRHGKLLEGLAEIAEHLGSKKRLSTVSERKRVTIVVQDESAPTVLSILGEEDAERIEHDTTELKLRFPEDGSATATALAVAVNMLGYAEVNVLAVLGTLPTCTVLVPGGQASNRAHDVLSVLTSPDGEGVRLEPSTRSSQR
jgi:hypothetical protein